MTPKQKQALLDSSETYIDEVKAQVKADISAMLVLFVADDGEIILTTGASMPPVELTRLLMRLAAAHETLVTKGGN